MMNDRKNMPLGQKGRLETEASKGCAHVFTLLCGKSVRLALWSVAAAGLLLAGCSKELQDMPGEGDAGELVEITFTPESMGEVEMDSRSVSGVSETQIKDLWIIQLDKNGTTQLQEPQYITALTASGTNYTAQVNIKAQLSRLYVIANTHNSTLYNGVTTEAQVESKTLSVSNESSLAPGSTLPMWGYFYGIASAKNLKNIALKPSVAKLTFKLGANIPGGSFSLTSVKLYKVPKVMQYFRHPDKLNPGATAGNCYPATSVGFTEQWMDFTPGDKTLSATPKDCGWCYLPENGRGTGSATDQVQKTAATALGGANGQGNYATYIEIIGDVTGYDGVKYQGTKYRIYLGSDAVSNYDVKRGTHYTVSVTISGVHEYDARITIGTMVLGGRSDWWDYSTGRCGYFLVTTQDETNTANGSKTFTYSQAKTACKNGWRLPKTDEILLMFALAYGGAPTPLPQTNEYWCDDENNPEYPNYLDFADGDFRRSGEDNCSWDTSFRRVRCIYSL